MKTVSMRSINTLIRLTNPGKFRLQRAWCPLCERRRFMVRLDDNEIAIRCCSCRASVVTLSLVTVLKSLLPNLNSRRIYELSSRGPLVRYLYTRCQSLTLSEYLPGVPSGQTRGGIMCQDVENLSFESASFDLCTSTDVFEHVADDGAGFSSIYRVLAPGGLFVFTVPLTHENVTLERAELKPDGSVRHLQPREYHGDPVSSTGRILAFRNYGRDINRRLRDAGFSKTAIVEPEGFSLWGVNRQVIVAYK